MLDEIGQFGVQTPKKGMMDQTTAHKKANILQHILSVWKGLASHSACEIM